ncbi:MAG: hypothetical protein R3219_01585 [Hydrogenovibrio sp.]|nr:hypothetical protein [Hydrogenovibrio sp.]
MRKTLLPLMIFSFWVAGCSQAPVEKGSMTETTVSPADAPDWVSQPPKLADSYDAVVSVAIQQDALEAKTQAIALGAQKIHHQIRQDMAVQNQKALVEAEKSYGPLEKRIRNRVRAELPSLALLPPMVKASYNDGKRMHVWLQISKQALMAQLATELMKLDQHLRNYIHVSEKGSNLSQLLSVLPALPTLEARKMLRTELAFYAQREEKLPNDVLASLLDGFLSKKMEEVIVGMEPMTQESKDYEEMILASMTKHGFNVTARQPDLTIKFFVEPNFAIEKGQLKLTLIADGDMINSLGKTFASVSRTYHAIDKSRKIAKQQAIDAFTEDMTQAMIDASIGYMYKANQSAPLSDVLFKVED